MNSSRPIVIAVIDSGIDRTKSDLDRFVVNSTGFCIGNEGFIIEDKTMQSNHAHATAIAMIIRQIYNNVSFISINILNERLATDGRVLIHALEETLNMQPDIIHLSLGTTRFRYRFRLASIIRRAHKENILIVAAAENQDKKCYPAYQKGVIGVKGGPIRNLNDYGYFNGFFVAPFHTNGINGIEELHRTENVGSSMAAAYMTAHTAKLKYENPQGKIQDFMKQLKDHASIL